MKNVTIVKFHDEYYIKFDPLDKTIPRFRPLKEFYDVPDINVPTIEYLKESNVDSVCKLLDIIHSDHNINDIEDSGIFKYIPEFLNKNNDHIYKLLLESDYKFINKLTSEIPCRMVYDCTEIKGVNLKHYMKNKILKNKYKLSELLINNDEPIDYEFFDEFKHLICIDSNLKKIMQCYIDNDKPIPPEIIIDPTCLV